MSTANSDRAQEARAKLGAELRRLRKASDMTQQALATRIGYSRVYITTIENGHDLPGREFVRLAGEVLGANAELSSLLEQGIEAHRADRAHVGASLVAAWSNDSSARGGGANNVVLEAVSPNGELVLVSIDRRTALKELGAAAFGALAFSGIDGEPASAHPTGGSTPLEHSGRCIAI